VVLVHAAWALVSLAAPGPRLRLRLPSCRKLLDAISPHQRAWPQRTPLHPSAPPHDTMTSHADNLAPAFAPFFGMVSVCSWTGDDFIANSSRAASPSQ
jgi:hypothetical protein